MGSEFSQKIRKLRLERQWSMKEVAHRLGVPTSTYRDWEYGRKISAENLVKIVHVFDVSFSIFLQEGRADGNLQKAIEHLENALDILRSRL